MSDMLDFQTLTLRNIAFFLGSEPMIYLFGALILVLVVKAFLSFIK